MAAARDALPQSSSSTQIGILKEEAPQPHVGSISAADNRGQLCFAASCLQNRDPNI